jgi:exopolysaccharide/PEP-CTERM locus tyrosine autokinase
MNLFRRRKIKPQKRSGIPRSGKHATDKKLVVLRKPDSYEAEQFRILKTKLLFPSSGPSPRCIMVTSGFQGVGKSFVSSNLAVSIAQSIDQYVLLMDCDMRKPTVHRTFGFGGVSGLSEYLINDLPLPSLLLKTVVPKLTLLPAGAPPPNPTELLSSRKMKALIEEVKNRYDDRYVIIDSPPLKIASETNAMVQKVDAVVLVVGYGETPQESVAGLVSSIGKEKIAAIVVNQCNSAVNYWGVQKHYYGYGG